VNIQYCFPTAIFSSVNEELADILLPIAKKFLDDDYQINKSIDFKTTYVDDRPGLEIFIEFESFGKYICNLGMQFMERQGYEMPFPEFKPFIFANEMLKNDLHERHAHANSILSGVIYLQVPEGSSPITFFDPKQISRFFVRNKKFPTESNMSEINIQPRKGLLLMWESWLEHSVPKNNSNEGRITMAFNLKSP